MIEKLKSIDEVLKIYETLEPYDIFIKVRVEGIYELKRNVIGVLSQMEGVINVSSILTTVRPQGRNGKYKRTASIAERMKDTERGKIK